MPNQPKSVEQSIQSPGSANEAESASWPYRHGRPNTLTNLQVLIASIAHEVNQPLSGILTNANACRRMLSADRPNIDGAAETVRRTIRDVQRVVDLINRLRALFATRKPVIEPVRLNEAVLEALALLRGDLDNSHVTVHCDLRDDAPPMLGDRILLQQVILNLVRNAVEAMSGTSERPRVVTIATWQDEHHQARLSVHDVGTGISPRDADRIFRPLHSTKPDGMGMGLCISRTIVERHGGRLWATANGGAGTTFWLSMPSQRTTCGVGCKDNGRPGANAHVHAVQTLQAT
jgi:C4-dicarboxylate-specific signal transduction histidine kinase